MGAEHLPEYLLPEEIIGVTNKRRRASQKRELIHLGIRFKERSDGTLFVLRKSAYGSDEQDPPSTEPDWSNVPKQ